MQPTNFVRPINDRAVAQEAEHGNFAESLASFSRVVTDIQINIGKELAIRDVLRLAQVSRTLNKAMSTVMVDYTRRIKAPRKLTGEIIVGLSKMRNLNLIVTNSANKNMRLIGGLTNVKMLDLANTKLTDCGLQELAGLRNLQRLNLHGTKVTDEGLEHITGLTQIHKLNLSHTKVTDLGLQKLASLIHLKTLCLVKTNVTDVGVQQLAIKLPNLHIQSS